MKRQKRRDNRKNLRDSGTKKIFLSSISVLLMLVNISCAEPAGKNEPTTNQAPSSDTLTRATDNKQCAANDGLIYLKVEKATASSFDETPDWAPKPDAMAAVDGNIETRWSSAYKDNQWIYFDFGKPKTLSKIIIRWEAAYAPAYEIQASEDAISWKTLVKLEAQAGGVKEIEFEPVTARYVKLLALARVNEEWGISTWEFEPYGPKGMNQGELPMEEIFKSKKEKTEVEEKRADIINSIGDRIVPSPAPITTAEFQRGVNYTSWDADELGTDVSDYSIIYLSRLGIGHIALMVVWYQDDAVSNMVFADAKKTASDQSLCHAINMVHALGMKVMLKPHVDLADEDARTNIIPSDGWFDSYKNFILHYAQLAAEYNVELFCVGTELSNTTIATWKERWLDIIKAVREIYKGPLTYAANWDEYETVSFWPAVDFVGMDAYFPLTKKNNPAKEELVAAWDEHAATIENWLKTTGLAKPVIFTEIGYDTVEGSNKQPWRVLPTLATYVESQDEQANCLESLLMVLAKKPWFKGFYWWNYFPRPDLGPLGYTLRGKKGEKILAQWYGKLR